ncbi:RHS repeat-associated core domain-containing protein [Dyella mobilis]|nr:RHS repeat-associated core domain-containing protein [Dyella mobilis]
MLVPTHVYAQALTTTYSQALAACLYVPDTPGYSHTCQSKTVTTLSSSQCWVELYWDGPGDPHVQSQAWQYQCGTSPLNASDALSKNYGNGSRCSCVMVGEPINGATGNSFHRDDDFDSGAWLRFSRFYNSAAGLVTTPLGSNWRHTYSQMLYVFGNPAASMVMLRPDGNREVFNKVGNQWQAESDNADVLTETDNANGVATSYTVFIASQRTYELYGANGLLQQITDASGQSLRFAYSTPSTPSSVAPAQGLLISVTDPEGRQLHLAYDNASNLVALTLPDGGVINYGYDANDNLITVAYPDNSKKQYVYNEASLTGGASLPAAMTGTVDETNTRLESTSYTSGGLATSSVLAGGVDAVQITYGSNGTSSIQTSLGLVVDYGYSTTLGVANIASVSQACGPQCNQPWKTRTYDTNGNPQTAVDFNGNTTATTYNSNNLLTQQVDAQGTPNQRTTTFTWNTALRVPLTRTVQDANGNLVSNTQWVYTATGQTLARCAIDPTNASASGYSCSATGTVPAGVRRTTDTYCTAVDTVQCPLVGLLLTTTGPRTDLTQTTAYSYYMASSAVNCGTPGAACYQPGDLHTVTDALGHVTTIASYDADGRITRLTDANGTNTDLTYYPRGWLKTRTVGGAQTSFTYTAYGAVQTLTDPDGVTTTYGYDAAHRLTKITDALGNTIAYTLDAAGDKTGESVYDASGTLHKSLTRTFNPLGQLTSVVDGLNQTVFNATASTSYDANGNLVQSSDALGIQRQLGYDALNRLVQTLDNYNGTDTATQNTKTAYQYDSLDRLTQVTDPSSLATIYSYDGLSDATGQQSPDTGTTSRTFDAAGNVLTRTDAKGIVATNTYDAFDRLTSTSYPDTTQNITYTYDEASSVTGCSSSNPVGRLTRIIESSVTTAYCYDAWGRVIQKQIITGTTTHTVGYSYTAAGRLSGIVSPDGSLVSYARDGDGRIQSLSTTPPNGTATTVVSGVTYQPFGPVSGYTLGNGQAITRTVDANYRLTDLTSPAFSLHVARDAMGDITAIGNAAGANPATETYSYDPLYRLTAVTEANGSVLESVTYNQTGDRLSKTGSGLDTGTYGYTPNTHQLVTIGNSTLTVDANGNTTAMTQAGSTYGFGYNDRNRMAVAQLGGSTLANYTYDALGQRIQKVANGQTESYVYNETGQLLAEYGATNRDYLWMDGIPVANIDTSGGSSTMAYVTADPLGTPRAIADASGNTVWQLPYQGNPWAEVAPTSSGYTYNLRFAGQYYDLETGSSDNGARTYDSARGGFDQPDPTGFEGGIALYAYGNNSPLSFIDPLGLFPFRASAPAIGPTSPAAPGVLPEPIVPPRSIPNPGQVAKALIGICIENPVLCTAAATVGGCLYPTATADSCADEPHPPTECHSNEDRCEQNLRRDMETCSQLGKSRGKNAFKICEQQAMLRYGNCLSERDGDDGINAPLPPWRLH